MYVRDWISDKFENLFYLWRFQNESKDCSSERTSLLVCEFILTVTEDNSGKERISWIQQTVLSIHCRLQITPFIRSETDAMGAKFKNEHTVEQRKAEAERIRAKYPDRIPVICEKTEKSNVQDIDKKKYLVPADLTCGQFVYVIRKRLKLPAEQAIFLFVNGIIPPTAALMNSIHEEHKDVDGFLYISYSGENTFGN